MRWTWLFASLYTIDDEITATPLFNILVSRITLWNKMRVYTKFNRYPLFVHFRYTRNLVDEGNGKFNLIVLCWGEQQASSIHSHANSHCFMKVRSDWLLLSVKLFDWIFWIWDYPIAHAKSHCFVKFCFALCQQPSVSC